MSILFATYMNAQQYPDILREASGIIMVADSLGNTIPDFSYAGYEASEQSIPFIPAQIFVPSMEGDATETIQKAIDYVGGLKPDASGFRGAILLDRGIFKVSGTLYIKTSGIVLRGSGTQTNGTTLLGTGVKREAVIRVLGTNDIKFGDKKDVTNGYTPLGATKIMVENTKDFTVGSEIRIMRPLTKAWIKQLKMEAFGGETDWIGWKEGNWNMEWYRTISEISGNTISFNAPLTEVLDETFGKSTVNLMTWNGRIEQVGIENLLMDSTFDSENKKDEEHRWQAIGMENVKNAWVRQVHFKHFAGGAVALLKSTQQITVEDCIATEPISEIAAFRRQTFYTEGQQTLFQRCYSEFGYNDFAVGGFGTTGPNVFLQCESHLPYSNSGAIGSWANGVLFDIAYIDGGALSYHNREQSGRGAGWTAANSVFWESSASKIECYSPPTSQNWAFGVWGQFAGNGHWKDVNGHINPRSLFYALLEKRLNTLPVKPYLQSIGSEPSSSPTLERAEELTGLAVNELQSLPEWIVEVSKINKIDIDKAGIKSVDQIKLKNGSSSKDGEIGLTINQTNGRLTYNSKLIMGKSFGIMWWRGSLREDDVSKSTPHVTRFVPKRRGIGLTDNIEETVAWLKANNMVALEHNYGLWYDRRMDDHERVRRIDADVWAPFYEQPFARSGKEVAWDHLSKYDLTKYNTWYWDRLQQYADEAEKEGQLLVHQQYFQHNILEAGAHWSSSPWRSANNINQTGFPEPPPYAGDKRIFMAEQFYDITNVHRKELHKKYIEHSFDVFKGNSNVIQLTSAEYTGPLHFLQFWLDVAKEWKKENNTKQLIGLSATKDVQDAILADEERAQTVDLIDIRYWYYKEDGTAYAPAGGVNLAPRQHARKMKTGKETAEQVYRAVREYREKYPEKMILYSTYGAPRFGWAVLMAQGSLPNIPVVTLPMFNTELSKMNFVTETSFKDAVWKLVNIGSSQLLYSNGAKETSVNLANYKGKYRVYYINEKTGEVTKGEILKGGSTTKLSFTQNVIFIIKK
ncbi:DUF6298 domain-containing protein [Neptunitalea lumnitzerae]|nr:DUF6298 domain-containing protein [Neptunitalea sp. Y10]